MIHKPIVDEWVTLGIDINGIYLDTPAPVCLDCKDDSPSLGGNYPHTPASRYANPLDG